jgi:predicted RNase H-like HicB family nuclease
MSSKISIQIEKTETGYFGSSPEIEDSQLQSDSYENILDAFKPLLSIYLKQQENLSENKTDQPIWEIPKILPKI